MGFWDTLGNIGGAIGTAMTGPGGAALGVGSSLLSAYLGSKAPTTKALTPEQIRAYMAPMQGVVNQMQAGASRFRGIGQDLMDPSSGVNQQQYGMMQEQGQDQLALQNLLARRQAASMGQSSGITAGHNRLATAQTARNLGQGYQQALMQNRQAGIGVLGQAQGMLGSIGTMQQGITENIAQSAIAQNQQQRMEEMKKSQAWSDAFSGIGTGLMQGYANQDTNQSLDPNQGIPGWTYDATTGKWTKV